MYIMVRISIPQFHSVPCGILKCVTFAAKTGKNHLCIYVNLTSLLNPYPVRVEDNRI